MAQPLATPNGPAMTDAEFRMFSQLVRDHCGLHFGDETRFLLEDRVGRRMRAVEAGSFAAYHYRLRSGLRPRPNSPRSSTI